MKQLKLVTANGGYLLLMLYLLAINYGIVICGSRDILEIDELKEWKKILKTRNNVLGAFGTSNKAIKAIAPVLETVATSVKGIGTVVTVDCKDAKKLCKTLKVKPTDSYILKHYQSGSFNKDYDRQFRVSSLISFMNDPSADPPWSEDDTAVDVRHVESADSFYKIVKKEKKPILVMFYAPWCGHCKQMKPEFASAATKLKGKAVLIGMNVDTPNAYQLRTDYNISGFPTVLYFEDGENLYNYWDERTEEGILKWMSNPMPQPEEQKSQTDEEQNWSDEESDVAHLTDESFDEFLGNNPSVLVMYYAPWCGHCKALKPQYTEAAAILNEEGIVGKLAAVDATAQTKLGSQFKISGYPTLKYFENGEFMFDYGYARSKTAIIDFMKDPQAPPPPEPEWSDIPSKVTHLTDETFKSFLKKKKHVLVFFYAPWCGHCKAAKPHFTTAANEIIDKKTAFAAIDCTKHPSICTDQDVQGYPTIKYFNYGKNEFKYMGPRTDEGFANFMKNPSSREEL